MNARFTLQRINVKLMTKEFFFSTRAGCLWCCVPAVCCQVPFYKECASNMPKVIWNREKSGTVASAIMVVGSRCDVLVSACVGITNVIVQRFDVICLFVPVFFFKFWNVFLGSIIVGFVVFY